MVKSTDQGGKPRRIVIFFESVIGTAGAVLVASPGPSLIPAGRALGRMLR
jgi:hypothetical protein